MRVVSRVRNVLLTKDEQKKANSEAGATKNSAKGQRQNGNEASSTRSLSALGCRSVHDKESISELDIVGPVSARKKRPVFS